MRYTPPLSHGLHASPVASDTSLAGDILVAVSILAVTACFGNFAFTYERVKIQKWSHRLLAHCTTGALMLLIGISLEMVSILSSIIMGSFFWLNASLILLYIASILYDFWDLLRQEPL